MNEETRKTVSKINPEKEIERVAECIAQLPVRYDMPYFLCWKSDRYVLLPKGAAIPPAAVICKMGSKQLSDGLSPDEWNYVAKKICDFFIPKKKKE